MREFGYSIKDALGIHARPAGLLAKEAQKFKCDVTIAKDGFSADAKRIFSLMKLAAKQGETVTVTCAGEDENNAAEAIEAFFNSNL